jgi:signal transduction histidine kinase
MRERGLVSSVGAPIVVEGRLWGVMVLPSTETLPADTEPRLASFAELVATAIANAEAHTELAASRARIVAATDEERRRVVRDLHDGAQQRLVHTIITLTHAQRAVDKEDEDAPALLSEALAHAQHANRRAARAGARHPPGDLGPRRARRGRGGAGFTDAGAGRDRRDRGPAAGRGRGDRVFVVAEALTNVAKHARARRAEVTARIEDGTLAVRVRDDGIGGARPDGSGLLGLADRLAALDGQLSVYSPADSGTLVAAAIPLPG